MDRITRNLIWLVVGFLIPVLLFLAATSANAHPLTDRQCLRVSADIYVDAIDRAQGVPLARQLELLSQGIAKCKQTMGTTCAYADEADELRTRAFLEWLYSPSAEGMTPEDIVKAFEAKCMAAIDETSKRTPGPAPERNGERNL